jgi:hypothetical protein
MTKIDDKTHAEVERLLNCAIHELVFACKHCEEDQPEDANNCLITAQMNIEQANELLVKSEGI